MSEMKITDIDLAKTNFYLSSINSYGKPAGKIKLSRSNLLNWLVQQTAQKGVSGEWRAGLPLLSCRVERNKRTPGKMREVVNGLLRNRYGR